MTEHQLDTEAKRILRLNDKGRYTVPTEGLYPYQWNWDSAFTAMGFATFDIDRAWTEIETLMSGQWSNGMVPHILFHTDDDRYFPGPYVWQGTGPIPSSGISNPPIATIAARHIFERDPDAGRARAGALYDRLVAWHEWFAIWRLDRGAVCSTHPWECGRDNAPDWDEAMAAIDPSDVGPYTRRDLGHVDASMRPTKDDYDRYIWLVRRGSRLLWNDAAMLADTPFRVADPTLTFTLLRAERDLAALGTALGRDTTATERRIGVLEEGADTLWNPQAGHYDSRNVLTGNFSGTLSNASYLCWFAGIDRPEMREKLTRSLSEVAFGVPSCGPQDPRFDGQRYWRGPVWAVMNQMIGRGLTEMNVPEAATLRQMTAAMISEHGFAEYFDPRDGSPAGGKSFTWTAAVWLGWASPNARI